MLKTISPFVLIIALLTTGCASSSQQTPAATPTLFSITNEWTIRMTHSGGIMGLMRSVEVSSNGNYTVVDEQTNNRATGQIAEDDLAKLGKVISSANFNTPEMPDGSVCADCFIYDIEIHSSGNIFRVQLNDINLPASGMEDLVKSLRELIDSALK